MRVLSVEQMRQVDRLTSLEFGVESQVLMENAGGAVAEWIQREYPRAVQGTIVVAAGKGNNGGDGLVAARRLAELGAQVKVWLTAAPAGADARRAWERLREEAPQAAVTALYAEPNWPRLLAELRQANLIVDALLGAGLTQPAHGLEADLIEAINQSLTPVVAVDLPSGLPGNGQFSGIQNGGREPAIVRAQWTVSFTAPKVGHLLGAHASRTGHLRVVSIGTPPVALEQPEYKLSLIRRRQVQPYLQPRARDSHKGKYGHLLLVAGSLGKTGAAAMAAEAGLRIGAGLVTVAAPKSCVGQILAHRPEIMAQPQPETSEGTLAGRWLETHGNLHAAAEWLEPLFYGKTLLAAGPGLSQNAETMATVRHIVMAAAMPWVLDADGLNAFAGHFEMLAAAASALAKRRGRVGAIVTPHPGEMARLAGCSTEAVQQDRLRVAMSLAARLHAIVVLKGYRTLVAAPDGRVGINVSGNAGLAKGGSGDVLTGIIAGLWGQYPEEDAFHLAGAAVRLHGVAADVALANSTEMSLLASDVIAAIPQAIRAEMQPEPELPWELLELQIMAIMPGELPAQLAQLYSASEAETREYGRRLAAVVPRPAMILLQGELGAGKTQLAKGLILGLGAAASEAEVVSPSYTLVHEYAARQGRVFHLDLYRLETPRELASLGMEEFMPAGPGGATSVVIVEWGGKLVQAGERSWLAGGWLEINIEITGGEQRHIQAAWHRARSARSLGLRPNAGH